MRAKDLTMTARTPSAIGPEAADSRDEPWPYVSPATMIPAFAALARVANSGSRYLKQNSAIAGMLERRTRAWMPEGMMSSVETLSPTLSSTGATSVSSGGAATGTGLMLGPLATSTLAAPAARRSATSPSRAITSRIRWLPGKSTKETDGWTFRPLTTWVTAYMSSQHPLVHEPTMTSS